MSALTGPRWASKQTIRSLNMPIAANATAWRGGSAAINGTSGNVTQAQAATAGQIPIGQFEQDNSPGNTTTAFVWVTLQREIECYWLDNATGASAVASSNFGQNCYIADDHTATMATGSNAIYGRVWGVDSSRGVLVQFNQF
jgi:hypothetical protein